MHDLVIREAKVVDGTGTPAITGDIAIDGDHVTAVGGTAANAHHELDGDGLITAPGWVDVHTHYDGQVTWDPEVTPSSWHGVTTVVMGNCGVGFAPVRPGGESFLIELMEGVEDIPRHRAARRHRVELGIVRGVSRRARHHAARDGHRRASAARRRAR